MRKVLVFVAAFAIVAGVFCGGKKTEAPKAATPVVANLPAGWPAEAFGELTKAEVDAYGKVLPSVTAALKAGNMAWDAFRITTYKVMAANNAMTMGLAEAMMKDMKGAEADAAKAEIAKAKLVFDQVPKANQEMIFTAMDQLKPLDELEGKTE